VNLRDEIFEQPAVIRRLIDAQWPAIREIGAEIKALDIDYIFLTARGTSDHAGLYAKYLWGARNRLPIALAAPSLFSIYEQPPRLARSLVVGISQSGQSPDIVSVMTEGRRQGAPTLAITNAPDSPLAEVSDWVIDVCAGPELAVAATKSYTAQLAAIALLSIALDDADGARSASLARVPDYVEAMLALDGEIRDIAERYRYMTQCVVLGRGYNYATAYEWALKLKELTYAVAAPYSSADFQHGPVAMVARGFPVLAVMPRGAVFDHLFALMTRLKQEHQVELLALSNHDRALALADRAVALPDDLPEWLSPIVSIVPGQLFCYYLTKAKGFDTESPRMLSKVTRTE
jgi:glucosamine--fructose-6-phosphate aminotransferase (isomerizing)